MTIDRARAAQLAEMLERCDGEMTKRPWIAGADAVCFEDGKHSPPVIAETEGAHRLANATDIASLRNAAPELAATIRGLVEECERMKAGQSGELAVASASVAYREAMEVGDDAAVAYTGKLWDVAVDAYRRSKP